MKTFMALGLLVSQFSYAACFDITGKYFCEEEAEDELALGDRLVEFKKSPSLDIYNMKVKNESRLFEVGAWNPGIDVSTGEIDYTTETSAECEGTTVNLLTKISITDLDMQMTMIYEVTPTYEGIEMRMLFKEDNEEDVLFKFNCKTI